MLADYISPFDATVVKRIAESGAVCLGKSSCDEFAMGSANQNCAFGPCLNPGTRKQSLEAPQEGQQLLLERDMSLSQPARILVDPLDNLLLCAGLQG